MYKTNSTYEVKNIECCDVTAKEQSEVRNSLAVLERLNGELVVAFNELESDLEPVLPYETVVYADAPTPPQSSAYSCPLARQIEEECRRVERLNDKIHSLLVNIKL